MQQQQTKRAKTFKQQNVLADALNDVGQQRGCSRSSGNTGQFAVLRRAAPRHTLPALLLEAAALLSRCGAMPLHMKHNAIPGKPTGRQTDRTGSCEHINRWGETRKNRRESKDV
ncbi:unnamed protein product [Ceratitis capitata]|uniref:(Mediterranean fruit fly) hypothetical protein n=1 Tax=Ceratitis capitata TaxID=7213 RepID=A0A811U6D3_CERCA|nr:unnamed protein product [Ceratitis capitata]